jgi:predicted CXXCH cytochrome family protein
MKKNNPRPVKGGAAQPAGDPLRRASPMRWLAAGAAVLAAISIAAYLLFAPRAPSSFVGNEPPSAAQPPPRAHYVGATACRQCHEPEFKTWMGSHHELAMQAAGAATVLGDFGNVKFRYAGVESTFFRRDGRFMVRTDGPDGKLADYEVKYTFGVTPLQQYLIEFPGGRRQALSIAWDARPKEAGGQRWFHLYPGEKIDHKDPLHWTGIYQNWNLQCAACHSTNLRKGYDAASNAYKTTYSDINVACEACHGPGSRHVEWAKLARPPYPAQGDKGLPILRSRWNEAWKRSPDAKTAERDQPAADALTNVCAACHARRSTIAEGGIAGAPLADTHRLALLTAPNYHADGQQRDEVYTWGSFLQSRMHQRGVTCMDCHEPHALKLRTPGNALCAGCHDAATFDTEKHHFHKAGAAGTQCVECHMPAQKYMRVDPRRDHSIRVPRPDLSDSIGSPDACTQCHTDRKPAWAAETMDQWYGRTWRDRPQYGTTLRTAATQGAKSLPSLLALAEQPAAPAIVRATAATLAQPYVQSGSLPVARTAGSKGSSRPSAAMRSIGSTFTSSLRATGRLRLCT